MAVNDAIDKAKAAWAKRDPSTAIKHLEDALFDARKEAPLEIRAALAVDEMLGLGIYTPAKDGVLKNRELNLYVEVANLRYEIVSDRHRVRLELEGTFFNDGESPRKQLGKPRKLGEQVYETRSPIGVAWLGVPLGLGDDFPPGKYALDLKVKDVAGSKSATKTVTFVVV